MSALPSNAVPFAFDTEFGADGAVLRASTWQPTKRSFAPAEVDALVAQAGFSGLVVFRDEPHLPAAAFALEWADGRAEFDPAEAEGRVAAALDAALAAEAGHAEPPLEGGAHDRRGF